MGKTVELERHRKIRSDKKIEIRPTVNETVYEQIAMISYFLNKPQKTVGERLVELSVENRLFLESISSYFRRDLMVGNKLFIGDLSRPKYRANGEGRGLRVAMRFYAPTYERICSLAFALDIPPGTTTGLLLNKSLDNNNVVLSVIAKYAHDHLTPERKRLLKVFIRDLNNRSNDNRQIGLKAILNYLKHQALEGYQTLSAMVEDLF